MFKANSFDFLKMCHLCGPKFQKKWELLTIYSAEGNKRSFMIFLKFSRPSWSKMSDISMNSVENIDGVEQIYLLTTCTAKLPNTL